MSDPAAQKLIGSTLNPDPADELACRIKDPLWFLARQWQSGEFQAENGGAPAEFSIVHRDLPLIEATVGAVHRLDRSAPLDFVVEAETTRGDAPGWQAAALEYAFDVSTAQDRLAASEYSGRGLDWWHFDRVEAMAATSTAASQTTRMVPTMLHFKGAPHPRWWRLEDGDGDLDQPIDAEPNALSTLLPEFFYTDIDNWFVAPLPIEAGSVRRIETLRVVDSFGVVTTLGPAGGAADPWRLFATTDRSNSAAVPDGSLLFVPHVAGEVLDNDLLEDVRFLRDEDANLVWAVERTYTDQATGELVHNGDSDRINRAAGTVDVPDGFDGTFRLQSETPSHWIPYVPRIIGQATGAPSGEIYLRRGRTIEDLPAGTTQYSGTIVAESIRLNEEEVGAVGIRVRRLHRYSRGSDGMAYHWVGRCRDVTDRSVSPSGLKFDFVVKP